MYGQAPGGQPPSPVPPMGAPAPPPRAKRPPLIVLAVAGLAVVLVVGVVGFAMFQAAGDRLTGPLKAEQCVDTSFGKDAGNKIPASTRVKCDGSEAKGTVLKVTGEGRATPFRFGSAPEPDCPEGTDGVANVTVETDSEQYYEACVRNIEGPHPGDPGAGGALLAVGDCVSGGSIGVGGKEVPCSGSKWYGKVIARAATEQSCPAKTLETMKLRSWSGGKITRPVVCLGAGGGVLATGDCIADPSFRIGGLPKADCGTEKAVAKVVGRVKSKQECPAEGTHFMTSDGGFLPVLCLKKLRPTLTEKLRSLGE